MHASMPAMRRSLGASGEACRRHKGQTRTPDGTADLCGQLGGDLQDQRGLARLTSKAPRDQLAAGGRLLGSPAPPWMLRGKSADLIQLPKLVLGECEFDWLARAWAGEIVAAPA